MQMIKKFVCMLIAAALFLPSVTFAAGTVDEGYMSYLSERTAEIESLVSECEARGISPDYEKVNLEILRRFNTRMREDFEDSDKEGFPAGRIEYNKEKLDELYTEAKTNLNAYLDGTKTAVPVPRYAGDAKVDGRRMTGDAKIGKRTEEDRPLFLTGYGHFNEAQDTIPVFQNFGANIIQTEIGPSAVFKEKRRNVSLWSEPQNEGAIDAKMEFVSEDARTGDISLKITSKHKQSEPGFLYMEQTVPVEPNTTYVCGVFTKGNTVDPSQAPFIHSVRFVGEVPVSGTDYTSLWRDYCAVGPSSDWKEWTREYTTGADQHEMVFKIASFDESNSLYLDDFYVKEKDKNDAKNLIAQSSFEEKGELLPIWQTGYEGGYTGGFMLSDDANTGSHAMRLTGAESGYGYTAQTVRVKPNTTYEVGCFAKAPELPNPEAYPYPHYVRYVCDTPYDYGGGNKGNGGFWNNYSCVRPSADYKENKAEYTTGPNQTKMVFSLAYFSGSSCTVLVDDVFVREKGTDENVLADAGFEEEFDYAIDYAPIFNMQDILESADDNDIAVSLLISSHYFPDFIMKNDPETHYPNEKVGGFMPCNINHPTVREVEKSFIELVLPYFEEYKSLNNILLSNEPEYQIDNLPEKYWRSGWTEYLSRTYGNIAELNAAYSAAYSDFSEVSLPYSRKKIFADPNCDILYADPERTIPLTGKPEAWDYICFNNEQFGGFHKFLADSVKGVPGFENMPVHAKALAHICQSEWGTWQNALIHGVDPDMFSEFSDISGNDALGFLGGGGKWQWAKESEWWRDTRLYPKTMWYDLLRSTKEAPVYNSEDHVMGDNEQNYVPQQAQRLYADMWQGAVHGRNMSTLWLWELHRDPNGDFSDSVSTRPDCIKAVGDANLDLNRLAYEVTALTEKQGDVAMAYSELSRSYSPMHMSIVYEVYRTLLSNGQKTDILTDGHIEKMTQAELNSYPVLVLPEMNNITEEMYNKFYNYTGKLVIVRPMRRAWTTKKDGLVAVDDVEYKYPEALKRNERNQEVFDAEALYGKAANIDIDLAPDGDKGYILNYCQEYRAATRDRFWLKDTLYTELNPAIPALEAGLKSVIADSGLDNVKVTAVDSKGNQIENIEWMTAEYDGRTIVNLCSYAWDDNDYGYDGEGNKNANVPEWDDDASVNITIGGAEKQNFTDLISGEKYSAENPLTIKPYKPVLLAFDTGLVKSDIRFTVNGAEKDAPEPGDIRAEITLANYGSSAETYKLYTGLYKGDRLVRVVSDEKEVPANGADVKLTAKLPSVTAEELKDCEIKAFLWKDGTKPVKKAVF